MDSEDGVEYDIRMKHKYGVIVAATVFTACVLNASTFVNEKPSRFLQYVTCMSMAGIDTGVPMRSGQSIEMKVRTTYRTGNLTWTQFFGDVTGKLTVGNSSKKTQLIVDGTTVEKQLSWPADDDVLLELETSDAGVTLKANGEVACATDKTLPETTRSWKLLSFFTTKDTYSNYRVYYARIRDAEGRLLADFTPCICRGQVAFHDAVSGRSFYPSALDNHNARWLPGPGTTSALFKGLDWIELDYTSKTSDFPLDTGVRARSGTKVELTFSVESNAGDFGIVGARNPDSVRFMLAHVYQNKIRCGYGSVSAAGDLTVEPGKTYTLVADYHKGSQTIDVDGIRVYTGISQEEVDTECNLSLFATTYPKTQEYFVAPSGTRIGRVRIWQGDVDGSNYELVRDYTPTWQDGYVGFVDAAKGMSIGIAMENHSWPDPVPAGTKPESDLLYVESGFGSVVDTGVIAADGIKVEMDMAATFKSGFSDSILPVLSVKTSKTFEPFVIENGKVRVGYNGTTTAGLTFHTGERQTVVSEMYSGVQRVTVNGESYVSAAGSGYSGTETLRVFGRDAESGCPVRLYGLKIWKGAADGSNLQLVRNLRPVVIGGRVALYDDVEGKPHYDMTSIRGGLVAGPRVGAKPRFHEYLEASGNQFVDTGVIGKTPIETQAVVEWTASDYLMLLGSRSGNDRVIPLAANNGKWQLAHGGSWWDVGTAQIGKDYTVEATLANGRQTLVVDDETIVSQAVSGDVDTGLPLYVFARNYSGASDFGKAKCRSLKIQSDGTPLRDFRACRLDGHSGFWDAVTESFFPAGAFPFTQLQELATGPKVPVGLMILLR